MSNTCNKNNEKDGDNDLNQIMDASVSINSKSVCEIFNEQ